MKKSIEVVIEDLTNDQIVHGWRAIINEVTSEARFVQDIFVMNRKEELLQFLKHQGYMSLDEGEKL